MPQSPGVKYGPAGPPDNDQPPNYVEIHAPRPQPTPQPNPAFAHPLPRQPFHAALHEAHQRVVHTQAQLPKQATPYIPRVPNPTPGQVQAALQLVKRSQERAIGPNPARARELAYHNELLSDPRQANFVQSVSHYLHASRAQTEAIAQRPVPWRGANVLDAALKEVARTPAQDAAQSRADAQRWSREGSAMLAHEREHGPGPLNLGFVNLSPLVSALATVKLPGSGALGPVGQVLNEAIDLPAQSFLSGSIAGNALAGALKGKPAEAQQLWHSIRGQVEDPIGSFEQAPLSSALMLAGGENAIGRIAGRAGRLAKGAGWADSARGAPRPDLNLYGGEAITGRRYNPDPLRALAQKGYEQALPKLPGPLRQADPFQAQGLRLQRNMVGGVTKVGRVDRLANAGEANRRGFVRSNVTPKMEAMRPEGVAAPVANLVAQRVVRTPATLEADLQKEVAKLQAAQPGLKGSELKANKANLHNAEAALADKPFMASGGAEAFRAAGQMAALQHPFTADLVRGGVIRPEQLRAALFPYMQAHLAAKHFTEADHIAAETSAAQLEQDAQARLAHLEPGSPEHAHAAQELVDARAHRYEVSGREGGPDAIAAHEHSVQTHQEARQAVSDAQGRLSQAEHARSRLVGAYGRARPAQDAAAQGVGTRMAAVEARIRGAKEELRGAQGAERDARQAVSPQPPTRAGMRTAEGKHISNEEVLAHMAANGVELPAFVSHKTGAAGRGSFFKSTMRQPSVERFARTGASFAKGTADHSWEALAGTTADLASRAAQLETRSRMLNRLGIGAPGEGRPQLYDTAHEAQLAADNFHVNAAGEGTKLPLGKLVPVHVGSGQLVEAGNVHPHADAEQVLQQHGLEQHTTGASSALGKYVLVPEQVQKRLAAHESALRADSNIGRALQVYQQGFRRAKLNTSFPHIFGVAQEQAIRLGAEQAGPMAGAAGAKFSRNLAQLAELDRHGNLADEHGPLGAQYRELASQIANRGGLAGSQRANDVTRMRGDQWQQTSGLGYVMHGAEGAARSRAANALGAPWRAWKAVFEGGLAKVEHGTRSALLGKALKDSGLIDSYHQLIGMTNDAVKAHIEGKLTPNMVDHLAEAVDNMGGNWNRQTPAVRKAVGKYAPFALWWLNSMRWLYRLPVTHPVKTAIGAALYQATREQRNAKGQGYDAAHPVPNFLQGTIDTKLPLVGAGKIAPSYYSPGGTGGPEWAKTLAEQFVPQFQSIFAAARSQNPLTGSKLTTAKGAELKALENALNVGSEVLTGPVPFATQAEKALTMGGKPYGTSNIFTDIASRLGGPPQVKPGSERPLAQVLGKMISPTRFDFPSRPKGGSGPPVSQGSSWQRAIERQSQSGSNSQLENAWKRALSR